MAHTTVRSAYANLSDRLNRMPQGAAPTELLFRILELLFSEREADLVSRLPVKPFTPAEAAKVWKRSEGETRKVLEELASRSVLLDLEGADGEMRYVLPPPMAGFFEFSLMRVRGDLDQKLLSELFEQYVSVEDDFMRGLFEVGPTQLGRTFVHEPALSDEQALHVLDYERASEVIRRADAMAVGMCYCRHKRMHAGEACDAPMDICMTFGGTAKSLARHDSARLVSAEEGLDLLEQAWEHNLVQFGENCREGVSFICNCCGCCCEALIAQRRFSTLRPIHTTNYLPVIDEEACNGCQKCADVCPVEAMTMVSAHDPHKPKRKLAKLEEDLCLGCGVCVRVCKPAAIRMERRQQRVLTPLNGVHRMVVMALERGKLQNLIFDNQGLASHRAMGALLGAVLKLPPVKRLMATEQVKSRYLEALVRRHAPQV